MVGIERWRRPSHKPVLELMGQGPAARVEGVREAVAGQIRHAARVDVRKAEQLSGEVGGVVVGAEEGSKVGVEHVAETALDMLHLLLPVFYHLQSLNMLHNKIKNSCTSLITVLWIRIRNYLQLRIRIRN
jgi:hypothetical protein